MFATFAIGGDAVVETQRQTNLPGLVVAFWTKMMPSQRQLQWPNDCIKWQSTGTFSKHMHWAHAVASFAVGGDAVVKTQRQTNLPGHRILDKIDAFAAAFSVSQQWCPVGIRRCILQVHAVGSWARIVARFTIVGHTMVEMQRQTNREKFGDFQNIGVPKFNFRPNKVPKSRPLDIGFQIFFAISIKGAYGVNRLVVAGFIFRVADPGSVFNQRHVSGALK
jgi:hypothetical protein